MVLKSNLYCRKFLDPNETLYVKILNNCVYYIYVYLSYTVKGRTISKQSPVFPQNKSQLLTFPSGALHVVFRIFDCELNPPEVIYTKEISSYVSSCYKIIGSSVGYIACVEIPC